MLVSECRPEPPKSSRWNLNLYQETKETNAENIKSILVHVRFCKLRICFQHTCLGPSWTTGGSFGSSLVPHCLTGPSFCGKTSIHKTFFLNIYKATRQPINYPNCIQQRLSVFFLNTLNNIPNTIMDSTFFLRPRTLSFHTTPAIWSPPGSESPPTTQQNYSIFENMYV